MNAKITKYKIEKVSVELTPMELAILTTALGLVGSRDLLEHKRLESFVEANGGFHVNGVSQHLFTEMRELNDGIQRGTLTAIPDDSCSDEEA